MGVHARIRAKSKGKRGIEDVLRGLLGKARQARGALPTKAWLDAVGAELGADEGWLARAGVDRARPVALAVLGATPEDRRLIDALRALVPEKSPEDKAVPGASFAAMRDFAGKVGTVVQVRALMPAAGRLAAYGGAALDRPRSRV
jgi:hypothetical protein